MCSRATCQLIYVIFTVTTANNFCKYFCKIFVRIFKVKSIFKKGLWWGDFPAIFGEVIATSSLARRDLLRHAYVTVVTTT